MRCLCLVQVASEGFRVASENSLWLDYRSTYADQDRWRCQGGDARGAYFALALLSVLSARRGTLWACSTGVLGGFRFAKAAGSSPAASTTPAPPCCSGAAGVATLAIAAHSDGCAGAGAGGRWAWTLRATRDASASCAGHFMCHNNAKIKSGPMRALTR